MTSITRRIVGEDGQIKLPDDVLQTLQLSQGSPVEIVVEDDQVTLRRLVTSPARAWLGIAPLPDGQTVDAFMRELRGKDEHEEPSPSQNIVWLKPGQPLPERL
ncbi:AbrB/MazE/SpoVT family DNA-binding domain-containing protein [Deinococcus sp. PESE-13]